MWKPAGQLPVLTPEMELKTVAELQKKNRLGWSIAPPVEELPIEATPEPPLAQWVNLEAGRLEETTRSRPECRRRLPAWQLAWQLAQT